MFEVILFIAFLFALLAWQHFTARKKRQRDKDFNWKPDTNADVVSDQSFRETGGIRTMKKPKTNRTR